MKILIYIFMLILLTSITTNVTEFQTKIDVIGLEELKEQIEGVKSIIDFEQMPMVDIKTSQKGNIKVCQTCSFHISCESHSMSPTFTCNDVLWAYKPTKEDVKIGDIIAFKHHKKMGKSQWIIHRIIDITEERYVTKGDNNVNVDVYNTEYSDILFKVSTIEYK